MTKKLNRETLMTMLSQKEISDEDIIDVMVKYSADLLGNQRMLFKVGLLYEETIGKKDTQLKDMNTSLYISTIGFAGIGKELLQNKTSHTAKKEAKYVMGENHIYLGHYFRATLNQLDNLLDNELSFSETEQYMWDQFIKLMIYREIEKERDIDWEMSVNIHEFYNKVYDWINVKIKTEDLLNVNKDQGDTGDA